MSVYNNPKTKDEKVGAAIYKHALAHRKGFRADQIGIPENDEIWSDIFTSLAVVARDAIKASK
jgi:hypothetical protein